MSFISTCIYCGEHKKYALEKCSSCNKEPLEHDDKVKSIILCYNDEKEELNFLSKNDFLKMSQQIKEGTCIFDADTFNKAANILKEVESVSLFDIIFYLFQIFWPLVIPILD